jgi:hypothetical protein
MAFAHAVYVYCVFHAARRPSLTRLPQGVPEGTIPEVTAVGDDLFLVTSNVPLNVYGPSHLEPRLRNLEWVSEVAVAHERVVEHFVRRRGVTLIPMKMFSMFSSSEKAVQDVVGRRRALARVFQRIAECEEWGIRVTRAARPAASPAHPRKGRARSTGSPLSGAEYLAARKDARDAAPAARAAARAAAEAAFARLRRLARRARRREEQPEPGSAPPLLEAAFLVPSQARALFKAEVRRQAASCAEAGAAMVLTGPWPAYNFVDAVGEGS